VRLLSPSGVSTHGAALVVCVATSYRTPSFAKFTRRGFLVWLSLLVVVLLLLLLLVWVGWVPCRADFPSPPPP